MILNRDVILPSVSESMNAWNKRKHFNQEKVIEKHPVLVFRSYV